MPNQEDITEAYDKGFIDALATFSWMKDGITYVGTCGTLLKNAKRDFRKLYNYHPPMENT